MASSLFTNINWSEFLSRFTSLQYPVPAPAEPDAFRGYTFHSTGLRDGFVMVTVIAVMAVLRDVIRVFALEPFARWMLSRDLQKALRKEANGNGANGKVASLEGNGHHHQGLNGNGNGNGHANGGPVVTRKPTKKELRQMKRSVLRFAEQGWAFISYTAIWSYGVWIHRNVPTQVLNPLHIWVNYPHMPLAGPIKLYYITQIAFYLHQVLILNAEAKRKDHWQMMTHHIVTICLLLMSYFYGYTRCGCLVLVVMDTVDIIFPLAKMLKYLNFTTICDVAFGAFLVTWFVTRHILFVLIIISEYKDMLVYMPYGWDPAKGYYVTFEIWAGFFVLLSSLQVLHLVWFRLICRVAYRVVFKDGADDPRSDDEDSDNEDKES